MAHSTEQWRNQTPETIVSVNFSFHSSSFITPLALLPQPWGLKRKENQEGDRGRVNISLPSQLANCTHIHYRQVHAKQTLFPDIASFVENWRSKKTRVYLQQHRDTSSSPNMWKCTLQNTQSISFLTAMFVLEQRLPESWQQSLQHKALDSINVQCLHCWHTREMYKSTAFHISLQLLAILVQYVNRITSMPLPSYAPMGLHAKKTFRCKQCAALAQ